MKKKVREILSKYRQNEVYTMEHTERELLDLFNVSKCQHPYKKVISGDDGMWCTECNKYITMF